MGLEQPGRVYDPIATVRSHWYLGRIYEARGDETRARRYLAGRDDEHALLDPDDEETPLEQPGLAMVQKIQAELEEELLIVSQKDILAVVEG